MEFGPHVDDFVNFVRQRFRKFSKMENIGFTSIKPNVFKVWASKSFKNRCRINLLFLVFGPFWGTFWEPKSIKNHLKNEADVGCAFGHQKESVVTTKGAAWRNARADGEDSGGV